MVRHAPESLAVVEHSVMAMSDTLARWTLSELHRLPDDGNRYELVHGALFVTPPPSDAHQEITAVLAELLIPYAATHRLGRVYFPRSVIRIGPHSEVEPDLMVRPIPARMPVSWAHTPRPILVVEVLSDATRRRDHGEKRALYLEAGVPEYWIVDGDDRAFRVVRHWGADSDVTNTLVWQPEGASAPLTIDVQQFFRTALGRQG